MLMNSHIYLIDVEHQDL